MDSKIWLDARQYTEEQLELAKKILEEIKQGKDPAVSVRDNPLPNGGYLAKHILIAAYRAQIDKGEWEYDQNLISRIRMKPIRTLSGVSTVTVLTKPYPCPGRCIFCPTDERMPKSYVPDEPGARRALDHGFDPFEQVKSRLEALTAVGHPTDKVELLILGGSWTAYPRSYQEWFVQRCFDGLNNRDSNHLDEAMQWNENTLHRNVGLAIETRPDHIHLTDIAWFRTLGVTKVQIGAQSLDDRILKINLRGHTSADTMHAVDLLRAGGFKIVLHWTPNLLGATPGSDREDFIKLWENLCPDEIKIYPIQLLPNTGLYPVWQAGNYQPYTTQELIELIADIKTTIPRYCRVNRIIRDIPSTYVVEGNKRTSLRQDIQNELHERGQKCECIRCREIRKQKVVESQLDTEEIIYRAGDVEEHFLSFITKEDHLAGFLRLSLPNDKTQDLGLKDLKNAAIIREVHVYGQSISVGSELDGAAQHIGLGTNLLSWAENVARNHGYSKIAVISAVGTRLYYLNRGYTRGELYLVRSL